MDKYYCIYCRNNLSIPYYPHHIKTRKHIRNKHYSIDKNLLSMPKDITDIIVKYYDDPNNDLQNFECRNISRIVSHKTIYFKTIHWYKKLRDRVYDYF